MVDVRRILGVAFLVLLVLTAVQVNVSLAGKNSRLKERVAALESRVASADSDAALRLTNLERRVGMLGSSGDYTGNIGPRQVRSKNCGPDEPAVWRTEGGVVILSC